MLKKKDILYYARIIPETDIYEVCEIKIRTVTDDWFAGIDKRDKHAYIFSNSDIDKIVFKERSVALEKVKQAEKNRKIIFEEEDE